MRLDPKRRALLDHYRAQAESVILARQDPVSGLLPASTAVTVHGDYTDAWVRDNVYSILAVWGLGLAYRRVDAAEADRLDAAVVRLMRGLLASMMKQSAKVERFKHSQDPLDALHAKYDTRSGDAVVGDSEWGHLQLDATGIFLLMLAQMTVSGLRIVQSRDEVDLVQNLVHYLGRADRTPDFGIWERGHKANQGVAEVNGSSVGMVKAALEAIDGVRLMADAAPAIHVPADDIANARTTLANLLPRESQSKETDAALLAVVGFPAFGVDNPVLAARTLAEITTKLEGRYGCKRFLRDGHQTVLEDHSRLHYEPGELARFEHIESEWPLFFTYLFLHALFADDAESARRYRTLLDGLVVERDGQRLLPELYYVPAEAVEAERAAPHSQPRLPNENVPLVWAQSLYLLGLLFDERLVGAAQLDPIGRRWRVGAPRRVTVQFALLASNPVVRARLKALGLESETREQMAPVEVRHPDDLEAAFSALGSNARLGLSGRPPRRPGALATSQLFTIGEHDLLFLPHFAHNQDSYLHLDNRLLVEGLRTEISYLQRRWVQPGRPLLVLRINDATLASAGADALIEYLRELQGGGTEGVIGGPVSTLRALAGRTVVDWMDCLPPTGTPLSQVGQPSRLLAWDEAATRSLSAARANALRRHHDPQLLLELLGRSRNPYEQIELLALLHERAGPGLPTPLGADVGALARELFVCAGRARLWGVIRRAAGLLDLHAEGLEDAVAQIVLRQKRIAVGREYRAESVIAKPVSRAELAERMQATGVSDPRHRAVVQEVLLLLGMLIKADRALFDGTHMLRPWQLLQILTAALAREHDLTQDEAFNHLLELSPSAVLGRLRETIGHERELAARLVRIHVMHYARDPAGLVLPTFLAESDPVLAEGAGGWRAWREMSGVISRLPADFHGRVWELMAHAEGLVIGDALEPRNRLESASTLADMTQGEKNFELLIEDLLNRIDAPEYRQLCIEALQALSHLQIANPDLRVDSYIVLDAVLAEAVRQAWQADHGGEPGDGEDGGLSRAWEAFYARPPHQVGNLVLAAVDALLEPQREDVAGGAQADHADVEPGECGVSTADGTGALPVAPAPGAAGAPAGTPAGDAAQASTAPPDAP